MISKGDDALQTTAGKGLRRAPVEGDPDESNLQDFLNLIPDAIVISNEEGRIVLVNSEVEKLFGFSRDKLVSQPVELLIPERFRAQHALHRKEFFENPNASPMRTGGELRGLREDGTEFAAEISLSAVQTREGLLMCSAIRDITERQRFEATFKDTAAQLAHANSELEQFAFAASHDLQAPLRTVVGATQLLAHDYKDKLDADAVQWLDFASAAAKRMQLLLNALLEYARIGGQRASFELVNCQIVYRAAVANLKSAIEESGARLTSDTLPVVMGDSTQLITLFEHLLTNAIKFTGQGHCPVIHVSAQQEQNEWRIAVADHGIGIDPKNFGQLFALFHRLHPPDQYPGAGIGLAICKKIVQRHGGRIWVDSALGEGSTFYFTLQQLATEPR
jgi:PAS domain S-box-containing protein